MRKSLITGMFILSSVCVMAQENGNRDANNKIVRGPYETNRFFDNWFFGVAGGVNVYEGESDSKASFGKRLAPALDISLGKWVTPNIGFRLQYSGLQAKGFASSKTAPYAGEKEGSGYKEKFDVMNLHADAMWNLTNTLWGYKETRVWNVIPYAGYGWGRTSENSIKNNELVADFGILNTFRLSKVVDLTFELRQMIVNQRFDGVVAGSRGEGMSSVTLGLQFNLGKSNFKRVEAVDYSQYTNRINQLENDKLASDAKNNQLEKDLADSKNVKPEATTMEAKAVTSPDVVIFFKIGKATLDNAELTNLSFYATYVKNTINADSNKTFTLIGSADKQTGTEEFNQKLSERRMEYVYNLLVNKYGISSDRLIKKAEGDSNNRFNDPLFNRCVVIE